MSDSYNSVLSVSTISTSDIVSFSILHPNIYTSNTLISRGNSSVFTYTSTGKPLWNYSMQNELTWKWRSDYSYNIKFDSQGNLFTSIGFFIAPYTDDIQFELQKFSPTGQLLGNFAIHRSESNTTDPRFNILDDNTILLVSHMENNGTQDINVMKLSTDMGILFNQTFGGNGKDAVFDYAFSQSGEVILLGLTYSNNFMMQNAFENTYMNLDDQPQVPGFVMIVDPNGQLVLSSYLINDPLLLNPVQPRSRSNLFLFMALIGFLSSFSMCYMYWKEKIHSISNWDTKKVLNEVSSLFNGNKTIGYVFWDISQDDDSVNNTPLEIPTQILGFKYFFHPVRLSILKLLSDHIKLSTVELRDSLDISWNVLNPHLLSLQENEYVSIKSDFSDGKLRKVIQITPNAITTFNEFKILLIEFLEKPGKEILLNEADEIKLKLKEKKDKLYPDG